MRTLNRTLLCVSIALVGAAGCASSGKKPPVSTPKMGKEAITPSESVKRSSTRIVVSIRKDAKPEEEKCQATIDDYRITGRLGKKVAWLVEDNAEGGCSLGEDWRIELQFENEWNNGHDRIVKIKRDDINDVRIHPNTKPTEGTPLTYKVYLVYPKFGDDIRVKLIDPELEIER
jgi:hypothetical protein